MNIPNMVLVVVLGLSGIFYLTGVSESKHSELVNSKGQDMSPALRGKPGEYQRNLQGLWFHYRSWVPSGSIRGLVFIAHGYISHSGRFEELAKELNKEGFAVFAHDSIGFGRSEGDRGHVEDWIYLVDDQMQFVESIAKTYAGKPIFLLGESVGALTLALAVQRKPATFFKGMILANVPLVFNAELPSSLQFFFVKLNEHAPKLPFLPADRSAVSSNPGVVQSYEKDDLCFHGWVRVRFYHELIKTSQKVLNNLFHIKTPVLILQGTGKTFMDPQGATKFYDGVASKDKSIKQYDGLLEELFEETDKKVIADTIQWLKARS